MNRAEPGRAPRRDACRKAHQGAIALDQSGPGAADIFDRLSERQQQALRRWAVPEQRLNHLAAGREPLKPPANPQVSQQLAFPQLAAQLVPQRQGEQLSVAASELRPKLAEP